MGKETSRQVTPPQKRNPTGKGGFGDNPQNRSNGHWKAENTISYQYNRFMQMSIDELKEWVEKTPSNELTVAMELAYNAVKRARKGLQDLREITDRTEGKAPQFIGLGDKADYDSLFDELSVDELKRLANGN
jgi:hypothetical protein